MTNPTYTITKDNVLTMTQTLAAFIRDAVTRGNVVCTLSREKRTVDQNALLWAVLTDISKQVVWHGQRLSPEDWKWILSAAWKGQKVLPGIDGGLVLCGVSTSKLNKADFSDLVEIIYAFGSENDVRWSDKSTATFEQYREAQA